MNIMDFVKPYITDSVTQKAAAWLGESQSGVAKAVSGALPTMMSAVLAKSENRGFIDALTGMLGDDRLNTESVLGNVGAMFSAEHLASPLGQLGDSFLHQLFGDKISALSSAIAQQAGVGAGSVSKILTAAAPLILALLSKQSASRGGLRALLGMLGSQKTVLTRMLPGDVASLLGLAGGAASAASSFSANQSASGQKDSSAGGWLWVLPLAASLGFGGWYFWHSSSQPVQPAEPVTIAPVADSASAVAGEPLAVSGAALPNVELGAFSERTLPGDVKLNIPANGVETKLVGFIEDNGQIVDREVWFDFDRIYFDTGSATLSAQSGEQVNNIAAILKAFMSAQIKVGGYTDSTGDAAENLALSQARADAVMNAIVALGVDAARLTAEGYGSLHPIAGNETEEGRQSNRRISVRVTAK